MEEEEEEVVVVEEEEEEEEVEEEVHISHYFTAMGPHLSLSCLQIVLQAV